MPLRSGKGYLIPHKCNACPCTPKYYSHKNFDYKCSDCWEYCKKNSIITNKEFGKKCKEWAKDNIVKESLETFIIKNKHISDQHLFNFLTQILESTGKYISAETGLELFNANPTTNRGHIVGSFIADWWEISSKTPNKKWPSYMDCYYGNYSEDITKWSCVNHASIPPKKPRGPTNDMVNNTIMMNIKF
jgi:hypothetical protein